MGIGAHASHGATGKLVRDTVERFGDLHAVVNNAGFLRDRMLTSMTEDDFDAVVMVHLKGAFALTRHACAYWKDQHKSGYKASGAAKRFGVRLLPALTEHLNPLRRWEAEELEAALAETLAAAGVPWVAGGH